MILLHVLFQYPEKYKIYVKIMNIYEYACRDDLLIDKIDTKYHSEQNKNDVSKYDDCFASCSVANQVNGLLSVSNIGAVVVHVPVAPRRFITVAIFELLSELCADWLSDS